MALVSEPREGGCGQALGGLTSLQPIDVLCVEPQEQPLVLEQPQEVVDHVGPVVPRVHLLGPREEGPGVVEEEGEFKNGLRVRDIAVLEAAVEAGPWRPAGGARASEEGEWGGGGGG